MRMVSGPSYTCRIFEACVVCRRIVYLCFREVPCDVSYLLAGVIMSLTRGKGIQLNVQIELGKALQKWSTGLVINASVNTAHVTTFFVGFP